MRAQKGKTIRARPTIERGLLEFADGFQIPVTQLKKIIQNVAHLLAISIHLGNVYIHKWKKNFNRKCNQKHYFKKIIALLLEF